MPHDPAATPLYHITDVSNLPGILATGGLRSDIGMAAAAHEVIGHDHIKQRRMTELTVPCRAGRFVGEFVPFYFCPRSPMLYTINLGNTGRPAGCQSSIVHLVSTIEAAINVGSDWAFSNGNAGARYPDFFADLNALETLDWEIIGSNDWGGSHRRNKKASEFLVADLFPWKAIKTIGCHNDQTADHVSKLLDGLPASPNVVVKSDWYY